MARETREFGVSPRERHVADRQGVLDAPYIGVVARGARLHHRMLRFMAVVAVGGRYRLLLGVAIHAADHHVKAVVERRDRVNVRDPAPGLQRVALQTVRVIERLVMPIIVGRRILARTAGLSHGDRRMFAWTLLAGLESLATNQSQDAEQQPRDKRQCGDTGSASCGRCVWCRRYLRTSVRGGVTEDRGPTSRGPLVSCRS